MADLRQRYSIFLDGGKPSLANFVQCAIQFPGFFRSLGRTVIAQSGSRDESEDVANDLNSLATANYFLGDYTTAEDHLSEAMRIAEKNHDFEGMVIYAGNQVDLALARKDWLGAERLARKVLPLAESLGKQESIALQFYRLAKALSFQRRLKEGLPYARKAVVMLGRLRSRELAEAEAVLRECKAGVDE